MNLRTLLSLTASLLLSGSLLTGCAFADGSGQEEANNRRLREEQNSEGDMQPVLGVWRGNLVRGTENIGVELIVAKNRVADGTDANNNPITRIEIKATFRAPESSRFPDKIFAGRFEKQTSRLLLTVPSAAPGPGGGGAPTDPDALNVIELIYNPAERTLEGTVYTNGSASFPVKLSFAASQQGENDRDSYERQQRRMQADLQPVLGRWTGTLTRGTPGTAQYIVTAVELQLIELKTATGTTSWGDTIYRFDPRATLRSTKDLRYRQMTLGGTYTKSSSLIDLARTPTGPDDIQTMTLTVNGDRISGEVRAAGYVLGRLDVSLAGRDTHEGSAQDIFDIEADIQRATYRKLEGFYHGPVTLNTTDPNRSCKRFNVCIQIYMQERSGPRGFEPILMASYYREDITAGNSIAEPLLGVSYNSLARPQTVSLSSIGVPQPNGSKYMVSITGNFPVTDPTGTADVSRLLNGAHVIENLAIPGSIDLRRVQACPKRPDPGVCLKN